MSKVIRGANAIETLRKQLNMAFPLRSKVSDGGVGDAAHSKRKSEHNPDQFGVFRARDFTHDPKTGIDGNWLAATLVKNADPRLRYVIWNNRIWKRSTRRWEKYTGANGHTHHVHVSLFDDPRSYDDGVNWKLDFPSNKHADDVARLTPLMNNVDPEAPEIVEELPTLPPTVDSSDQVGNAAVDNANATSGPVPTDVLLTKEKPSLFTRVITGIMTAIATAIATVTSTCGGSEVAQTLASRSGEKVVENASRSDIATFALIVAYIAVGLAAAVALLWVASKFYGKSADRSNKLNDSKINAAADVNSNNVDFAK